MELQAIWRILLISLLLGAGLPALFALGIRALALTPEGSDSPASPGARVLGYTCFAVVVLVVLLGIALIVASGFGQKLEFSGGLPSFQPK
nr:hypothetical protein [Kineosporia babensis]